MNKSVILVVDDDPVLLKILCRVVEVAGYTAVPAKDAYTAVTKMRTSKPELILEDLSLPDLNGVELVQCIRRIHGFETIPVIFISASAERLQSAKTGDNHPLSEYFVKPLKPSQLLLVIAEMLAVTSLRK